VGTLLDAFALIALLRDEPAADHVHRLIAAGDASLATVNLAEAGQRIVRAGALQVEELDHIVSALPLTIVPFGRVHAMRAAELRAVYYDRRTSDVSLADCCLVAVATPADRVATGDPAVLRMAQAEGLVTVELERA
jgi:PIN domain nuclease of toxin-antitoxin system